MKIDPSLGAAPLGVHGSSDARARKAASEFEALLLGELFKSMRKTVPKSELSSGFGAEIYTGMLDEQLGKVAAFGGGLGLTELLAEQLGAGGSASAPPALHEILTDGSWVRPVDGRRLQFSPAQQFGAARQGDRPELCIEGHCGIDLARPEGVSARAARSGVVTKIGRDPGSQSGLWVEVSHGRLGLSSRYLHLSNIREDLSVGQTVQSGELLGEVGATGTSARGSHLHFELRYRQSNGKTGFIDPERYLGRWPTSGS